MSKGKGKNMYKKSKIIVFSTMLLCILLLASIAFQIHIDFYINFNKEKLTTFLKVINLTSLLGIMGLIYEYLKIKRLYFALSSEVGFIARAVFHTLSSDKIKIENIKETFTISNAIIHTVGSNISLLDKESSQQILEFHSLMKVVLNTIESKATDEKELLLNLFNHIVKNVENNKIALNIVTASDHAKKGFKKAKNKEINLI